MKALHRLASCIMGGIMVFCMVGCGEKANSVIPVDSTAEVNNSADFSKQANTIDVETLIDNRELYEKKKITITGYTYGRTGDDAELLIESENPSHKADEYVYCRFVNNALPEFHSPHFTITVTGEFYNTVGLMCMENCEIVDSEYPAIEYQGNNSVQESVAEISKPDTQSTDSISALTIISEYKDNAAGADAKYLNKTITVTGSVARIKSETFTSRGAYSVRLGRDDEIYQLICYFPDAAEISSLKNGESVTISGKITGVLLGSPYMEECKIVQ